MTGSLATNTEDRFDLLDSCLLSDVLDVMGLPGAVAGIGPVWEGAQVAGRVITMTVAAAPGAVAERHLGAQAIDQAMPGDVVVVRQETPSDAAPEAACWGGLLAQAAILRDVAGVIVDGACRDVDEIRGVRLPVHARTVVPRTARRRYVETSVGTDIDVGGVAVHAGDYVLADGSGVVFIPAPVIGEVITRARRMLAREQQMIQDLRSGLSVSDVLGRDYEKILDDA
jgi:regulator of RNase E activity RraA